MMNLIDSRWDNISKPCWDAANGPEHLDEPDADYRVCDLVSETNGKVFKSIYIDALVHGFQPLLSDFFYDVLEIFNITPIQLQPSCWDCMAAYFF